MTDYFENRSHRHLVRGLQDLFPVTIRGQEYAGLYFSGLVSINPEDAINESMRTPQLIAELGILVAAAAKDKQVLEAQFRSWRDSKVVSVTTDSDEAEAEGLTDGKKPAAHNLAETWVRTLPEYVVWQEKIAHAEEAWASAYAALKAAESRKDALFEFRRSGVDGQYGHGVPVRTPATRVQYNGSGNHYDEPPITDAELPSVQQQVESQQRTPLPPPPPKGPPPPPPPPPKR